MTCAPPEKAGSGRPSGAANRKRRICAVTSATSVTITVSLGAWTRLAVVPAPPVVPAPAVVSVGAGTAGAVTVVSLTRTAPSGPEPCRVPRRR